VNIVKHIIMIAVVLVGCIPGTLKGEHAPVPKSAVMPALLNYLMTQGVTIKIPPYKEKEFDVVFDTLPDLTPEKRKMLDDLQLQEARLRNIEIRVKLDNLTPVSLGGEGTGQTQQYFYLDEKNDVHCKIKSFWLKADLTIERKGKDLFGNRLSPLRATIKKFELEDVESWLSFFLRKDAREYYAENLALTRMVLSPKASIEIQEFPPVINSIISDAMGPAIAEIANREVLNDAFYREFNTSLPPRIPEATSPSLQGILQDILK